MARILHLPAALVDDIRVYRARHGVTNTIVLLRALNATHAELGELVAADLAPPAPRGEGLFAEPVAARPYVPRRQVEVTPTGEQLAVIDPLVEQTGARDRSHLCAVAIAAFLSDSPPTLTAGQPTT